MRVDAKFLGNPEVLVDGAPVELEQKKLWALLLYVLYNGSSTRDELAELLWCDYPEDGARRNLRNCLYKLKAIIGDELLDIKGHSIIRVSPDVVLKKDIDLFITEDSEGELLSLDNYTFLDHFYVRRCSGFEEWVGSIRNVYERLTIRKFTQELRYHIAKRADRQTENYAVRILRLDPYNEEAGRAMMQVYMDRGDYNSALLLYCQLRDRVEEELGAQLEPETIRLYEQVNECKSTPHSSPTANGGAQIQNAVDALTQEYHSFIRREKCHHCILNGGIGMGKSNALDRFLDTMDPKKVITIDFKLPNREVMCYGVESLTVKLRSWLENKHVKTMGQRPENPLYYTKGFETVLQQMSQHGEQCIVVLRNVEAIDRESVDILISCLFDKEPDALWLLGEYCPNYERNSRFSDKLFSLPTVRQIYFPLLSEAGSSLIIYNQLGHEQSTDEIVKAGYLCSGGNQLLLQEYIENIKLGTPPYSLSDTGKRMVEKLLSSLNTEEYLQVEYLSVLDGAEVETLADLSQLPTVRVVQTLDQLHSKGWICEEGHDRHLLLKLRFGMIRELLYSRMANFKRQELHRISAEYFEKKYLENPKDFYYLSQTKRNYGSTLLHQKKIYYNVVHLEYILDFYDEFFPTIVDKGLLYGEETPMSRGEVYRYFQEYRAYLLEVEEQLPHEQFYELQMKLDFLEGRARIRGGEREKGIVLIRRMIELAEKLGRDDALMKGYVETLCYSVRAENLPLMEKYIKLALGTKTLRKYEKEHGVLLRLQGYLASLREQYDDAERYLKESVEIFENPKLIGINYFNLAAAYDYLSLVRRSQGRYDEALEYINKAIEICTEKGVQKSLDLFYEDCGYILFLKEDYARAKQYFLKSIELYDRFDTYWLRSIAESGLAMIFALEGNKDSALVHFRQAEMFSQKEHAHEEQVMLKKAKAFLKAKNML